MKVLLPSLSLGLALLTSGFLSAWLARAANGRIATFLRALDHPNERSLHQQPTPRTGGLAIIAGFSLGLVLYISVAGWPASAQVGRLLGALLLAVAIVGGVSLIDDLRELPRRYRLLAHILAAAVLVTGGMRWETSGLPGIQTPLPALLVWPLSVLLIVWMINLYNFMDGMDGFAATMALFGFGALAWLGFSQGAWLFALVNALVVASASGFLSLNFPPARLFMGDVGSSVLGLFAAGLSLRGAQQGLFPLWVAVLAFSPFIVDATWTLLRRALKGERVWEAHRSHHYQRLVLAGWSHRKTLVRASVLMAAAALCAVAAPRLAITEQWTLILAWAGIYALIHWRVTLAERQIKRQAALR
ncbi:putative undecaprenyl-phosphate N-acetylglucosaminyl 1-phosphate transferase [Thiorhodovibrio litoralis]|nr:putative undecaprenyl-phosphate N-acetylglucosaminyl 1-phosphate transferase [Thiorhodovibrio litoralis]